MTMLAELVDVVIGVDTHKHTHTAAVVVAATGAAPENVSVDADLDGYATLVIVAAVAIDEQQIAPKPAHASTVAIARPPRRWPTTVWPAR